MFPKRITDGQVCTLTSGRPTSRTRNKTFIERKCNFGKIVETRIGHGQMNARIFSRFLNPKQLSATNQYKQKKRMHEIACPMCAGAAKLLEPWQSSCFWKPCSERKLGKVGSKFPILFGPNARSALEFEQPDSIHEWFHAMVVTSPMGQVLKLFASWICDTRPPYVVDYCGGLFRELYCKICRWTMRMEINRNRSPAFNALRSGFAIHVTCVYACPPFAFGVFHVGQSWLAFAQGIAVFNNISLACRVLNLFRVWKIFLVSELNQIRRRLMF